uniref:Uncharacterized protein n=1 Tax=Knipowitschia caucasica TaxID=637954 RepID=A0AAV2LX94_KNICA
MWGLSPPSPVSPFVVECPPPRPLWIKLKPLVVGGGLLVPCWGSHTHVPCSIHWVYGGFPWSPPPEFFKFGVVVSSCGPWVWGDYGMVCGVWGCCGFL